MKRVEPTADGSYLRALLDKDFTGEQMAVITAPLSPQLVVAGAGSGKTMVMAARVVHAVAHFGVRADRILGVTFTNKAAAELAERVRHCLAALPPRGEDDGHEDLPTVATYNSYAAQIVRDHALRIGREPGATLLTEAVQWQLAMRVASRAPGPFPHLDWTTPYVAELVVALAGEVSDHLCTHEAVRAHDAGVRAAVEALPKQLKWAKDMVTKTRARDELLTLVELYNEEKARLDLIDFGDQVALIHGKMGAAAKQEVMDRFARNETKILVATTVIEVGVDVPNASIMIIEHAERFGLAQLHQLRGRVGRGSNRSACLLLYKEPLSETARARLDTIKGTEDGFVIAERDLELRGQGDILGTRQSGMPGYRLAVPDAHRHLLDWAHDDAKAALAANPGLTGPEGEALRTLLYLFRKDTAIQLIRAG